MDGDVGPDEADDGAGAVCKAEHPKRTSVSRGSSEPIRIVEILGRLVVKPCLFSKFEFIL